MAEAAQILGDLRGASGRQVKVVTVRREPNVPSVLLNEIIGGFSENTGAAVAICSTLPELSWDPAGVVPVHYHGIPDTYKMFHTFSGGGIVLKWLRDEFCEPQVHAAARDDKNAYDVLGSLAATVEPGADGLLMLPHLQGAMAPENNENARGVLMGLTLQHTRAHVVRALMEGICFVVRRNVEAFCDSGCTNPTDPSTRRWIPQPHLETDRG